jgi:MoaA/NifB/PqqE/SkfB family radical SAM enzyme
MSTLFNTQTLHIEVSSKCTLKCPRCPRTELAPEALNQEFSLSDFTTAFPASQLANIKKILFCGDIGDPIYATDFLEIIKYIKQNSSTDVSVVTNGSYKKPAWWQELGQYLNHHDTVVFSVDGWDQDSNNLYRVNSNWNSIIAAIKTLKAASNCRVKWSAIYFNFNETRMDEIQQIAQSLGCDEFQTVRSSKFNGRYAVDGVDPLIPVSPDNRSDGVYVMSPIILKRPPKAVVVSQPDKDHEWARCLKWEKELFINVDGLVFPCPWFNSGYQTNDFVQKYRDRLNVKTRSLEQVLNDDLWDEFVTRIETMPLEVCRIKCRGC